MSKIIEFPRDKIVRDRSAANEKNKSNLAKQRQIKEVQETVDDFCHQIVGILGEMGYDVSSENFMKDFAFVVQSLESCVLRTIGIEHQMQIIHDTFFEMITPVDPE